MFKSKSLLKLCFGAFIALPLAACVSTQTQTPQVAEAAEKKVEEAKKVTTADADIVCKRTKVTGTNFKKKVCLSRAERAKMREEAKKMLEKAQSSTAGPDYKG